MFDQEEQRNEPVVPDAQELISLRNQKESPLLRLPAELRNAIFEHIVAGITVDIFGTSLYYSRQIAVDWYKRYHSEVRYKNLTPRHLINQLAFGPTDEGLGFSVMDLNLICRQIHSEFALLPYRMITFLYSEAFSFFVFSTSLTESQRGAIETIAVRTELMGLGRGIELCLRPTYCRRYNWYHTNRPLAQLTGLRQITHSVYDWVPQAEHENLLAGFVRDIRNIGGRPGLKVQLLDPKGLSVIAVATV